MEKNFPTALSRKPADLPHIILKNRENEKVEIDYIEKKHVKKPAKAKPGFVIYHTNYSLIINSDISKLEQV